MSRRVGEVVFEEKVVVAARTGLLLQGFAPREPEDAVAAVGGTAGLIDGNAEQFVIQIIATVFTVAFAAISCGIYGYPLGEAADVALGASRTWLGSHPDGAIEDIIFVLRGSPVMAAFRAALERQAGGSS